LLERRALLDHMVRQKTEYPALGKNRLVVKKGAVFKSDSQMGCEPVTFRHLRQITVPDVLAMFPVNYEKPADHPFRVAHTNLIGIQDRLWQDKQQNAHRTAKENQQS